MHVCDTTGDRAVVNRSVGIVESYSMHETGYDASVAGGRKLYDGAPIYAKDGTSVVASVEPARRTTASSVRVPKAARVMLDELRSMNVAVRSDTEVAKRRQRWIRPSDTATPGAMKGGAMKDSVRRMLSGIPHAESVTWFDWSTMGALDDPIADICLATTKWAVASNVPRAQVYGLMRRTMGRAALYKAEDDGADRCDLVLELGAGLDPASPPWMCVRVKTSDEAPVEIASTSPARVTYKGMPYNAVVEPGAPEDEVRRRIGIAPTTALTDKVSSAKAGQWVCRPTSLDPTDRRVYIIDAPRPADRVRGPVSGVGCVRGGHCHDRARYLGQETSVQVRAASRWRTECTIGAYSSKQAAQRRDDVLRGAALRKRLANGGSTRPM